MKKTAGFALVLVLGAGLFFATRAPSSEKRRPGPRSEEPEARLETASAAVPSRTPARARAPRPGANANGGAVFRANWGGARDELGRERPNEGNPMGPMSFAADSQGRVTVLDGVNSRLVRRAADGSVEGTTRLDVGHPEDLAVGRDGSSAVLDRFSDKAVAVYDESGHLRGKLPIAGEGIDDIGSVTGVFVDGRDVYVEREHGPLVKIGTTDGAPAEPRSEIPGRPSRDGQSFLKAGIIEPAAGRTYVTSTNRETKEHRFTRELRTEGPVRTLQLLDTDLAGVIYFAAEVTASESSEKIELYCLDPATGAPVGRATLPVNTMPEESFRDLVVLDQGGVIQALRTEKGVSYSRYDCE
ncbi:MAG: hypothetical protein U0263_33970 [Polyangiaceae bacterium]